MTKTKADSFPIESVALTDLHEDPANAMHHDDESVAAIASSLQRFGQQKPIVIDKTGKVIAGNGTLRAATKLGWKRLVAHRSTLEGKEAVAYALADNRTAQLAEWDFDALKAALAELDDETRNNIRLDGDALEAIRAQLDDGKQQTDVVEDETPEPPANPVTKVGDLWILGDHRLLCGDSTKPEDVARLMSGNKAAFIMADPPYFAKVDADWDNDFDGYEGFLEFLKSVFAVWSPQMMDRGTAGWWCAPDFAWHIEGLLREHFAVFNHIVWYKGTGLGGTVSVEDMRRWRPRSERLLLCEKQHSPDALLASFNAKTSHIAARSAYASIIERLMGWQKKAKLTNKEIDQCLGKNGMAGHYFGKSQWALPTREAWDKLRPLFASRGVDIGEFDAQRSEFDAQRREFDAQRREFDAQHGLNATDVWEMSAPSGEDRQGHPTPKPVAMISKLVSAHSRPADLVTDPFLGSGTTLVAAEQLHRKCYGVEISPAYCDVIVRRWQKLTGKSATLEADGLTFERIERGRLHKRSGQPRYSSARARTHSE